MNGSHNEMRGFGDFEPAWVRRGSGNGGLGFVAATDGLQVIDDATFSTTPTPVAAIQISAAGIYLITWNIRALFELGSAGLELGIGALVRATMSGGTQAGHPLTSSVRIAAGSPVVVTGGVAHGTGAAIGVMFGNETEGGSSTTCQCDGPIVLSGPTIMSFVVTASTGTIDASNMALCVGALKVA